MVLLSLQLQYEGDRLVWKGLIPVGAMNTITTTAKILPLEYHGNFELIKVGQTLSFPQAKALDISSGDTGLYT